MSDSILDIDANRGATKWSAGALVGRVLWALVRPLFSLSPRQLWVWRRVLLRGFGAKVGKSVHIYPSVRVMIPWNLQIDNHTALGDRVIVYNLGMLTIGRDVTVSQGAHLCGGTHDYKTTSMPLLKAPIVIGRGAWICADAFVGPFVTIGEYAIVGARAVVTKSVPAKAIMVGNPARAVGDRTLYGDA